MNVITQKANRIASPLLILFAFVIPLSTSLSSITALLLILTWLCTGNKKKQFHEIATNPVAIAVLCYLLLHVVGLLWTTDLGWGVDMLTKQWKLLLFPLFLTLVRKAHIKYYLAAFVLAILIVAYKAYLVWFGVLTLPPASIFTTRGTTHVTYNPMLALAVYILLQDLLFSKGTVTLQYVKIFLLFFLSGNMFITVGRTGQAVFFILLAITLFQIFFKRSKKLLLAGLLFLPVMGVLLFQYCPTFQSRINTAVTEIQNVRSQQITSMGCRVWFYQNTLQLIEHNWLTGVGTGDFPSQYKAINMVQSPAMPSTDNPHNQYLMIAAQFGIVGIISLFAIFVTQLIAAFSKKDTLTPLRQAFPLFFLVIMLAESYLQVAATGFLFALFSSFLYKDLSLPSVQTNDHKKHANL